MAHKHGDIFENRTEFQLERMILFSDAVFAIAITLLVLDLKMPELTLIEEISLREAETWKALENVVPRLLGFIFSFFIIGQYWVTHHRLFGFITNFDGGLVWLNLLMLFFIVLVPFTTSFNFSYNTVTTWVIYSLNLAMVSFSIYLIWTRISNLKLKLTSLTDDPLRLKYGRLRSTVVTIIFLMGLICLIPNMVVPARFVFILIFPAMRIVAYRYNRAVLKRDAFLEAHPQGKRRH